jgi:hypothetical protein
MEPINIFVSVGGTANSEQETFVCAVEDRLRSEGFVPHTVGRNTFSTDAPLKTVTTLLSTCAGTVVIALERSYFPSGTEKRGGSKESPLANVALPTPWNQIEAAMAYGRGLPLLVIVEESLKKEGLLEQGYDWYVQSVKTNPLALTTIEFNGVLASWKDKVISTHKDVVNEVARQPSKSTAELTIGELISGMRPSQLWGMLGALGALVVGAFALGAKLLK